MTRASKQNAPEGGLRERVSAIPGVTVEHDDDHGVRLEFRVPDVAAALRIEWPTVTILGAPALAIIISAIVQIAGDGAGTAAQITVLIFVAPVLLILAFVLVYWRKKSRRVVRLADGVISPGPWMLAQAGEHVYARDEIIRLELVKRSDSMTRLTPGRIVVETAFHRATFGGHLRDDELELLWEFVTETTGMDQITIPWKRMVAISALVGLSGGAITFVAAGTLAGIDARPQLLHAFGSLTVGAVVFGLVLGVWRRQQPTLKRLDDDTSAQS